jgi:ABC-2 type transport system permease protein
MWMTSFYDSIANQKEQFEQLIQAYPKEIWAFFGGVVDFLSPEGFISVELYSYLPLVLGIFAVLAGSGLLVADEEKGFLDLLGAHPVSRTGLFFGRLLSFVAVALGILALVWLGMMVGVQWSTYMNFGWGQMWLPNLSVLASVLLFGTLSLFLSMVLPSRRLAASVGGLLLVASFFINGMAELNADVAKIADYLPMKYYQGGQAISGLNMEWFGGLMIAAVVFALLAWWRFERRDIRVGGEGGWGLPKVRIRRRARAGRSS